MAAMAAVSVLVISMEYLASKPPTGNVSELSDQAEARRRKAETYIPQLDPMSFSSSSPMLTMVS